MQYRMLWVLGFALFQTPAHALERTPDPERWQLTQAARSGLSLNEAVDLVQRRTGGRVLAAQAAREQGREIYRIKILTQQGEVRIVLVDAATGSME